MSFGQAVKNWGAYLFHFSGRASRSEFWWIQLFWLIIFALYAVASFISLRFFGSDAPRSEAFTTGEGIIVALLVILSLTMCVTTLALGWRRLHDAGFPGFIYLLQFVGIAGLGIVPLILCIMPSSPTGIEYDKPVDVNRP
ncbi:DUF805 domain-containing protein [Rothia terrae]|uniref:DUF805 domain-containing protein n=1 Tax=Rothia terrae TaxID=396015 RepID=A0A7H2BFH9_9MICC|nr:DUF805 domain-containing protein [Rothia terrae]QNV38425.1 DUF805 domain-containing protein [Rothia terrae]